MRRLFRIEATLLIVMAACAAAGWWGWFWLCVTVSLVLTPLEAVASWRATRRR